MPTDHLIPQAASGIVSAQWESALAVPKAAFPFTKGIPDSKYLRTLVAGSTGSAIHYSGTAFNWLVGVERLDTTDAPLGYPANWDLYGLYRIEDGRTGYAKLPVKPEFHWATSTGQTPRLQDLFGSQKGE